MGIIKKTFLEVLIVIVCVFVLVLVLSYFISSDEVREGPAEKPLKTMQVRINDSYLNLEVADDDASRMLGLMNRENLDIDGGMIFVHESERRLSYWMKNVLIPLDMIFINEDLEIVGVIENVPICVEDPCPLYSIEETAKYVIEVNAGWFESNSLSVGDKIEFLL